jgi:phenylacetate-CoA ligase
MEKHLHGLISDRVFYRCLYRLASTPVHPRFRVNAMMREKQELMRAPVDRIRGSHAMRMHNLLVHASRHCDFYRERFAAAGLTKESDLVIENIDAIPTLTKSDIQTHFAGLLSSTCDRKLWRENSSGGSSGHTVVLMQDPGHREEGRASTYVSDCMQGWRFGNRTALLWGAQRDTGPMMSLNGRILRFLQNLSIYDSFDMGPERMLVYHNAMERSRPDNIIAYAGSAYLFAQFLLSSNLAPSYPRVSFITSAETLTDAMRATIERCFGVPVYNRYGSREVGLMGTECSCHSGLHLPLDKHIETLDFSTKKPVYGEEGTVAVTLYSNYAMPLIRYEIGDVGILDQGSCSCGVNTPKFRKILGRSSDFIVAPSGKLIHGEYFTHIFYGRRNVGQFQFVQQTPTHFMVRIVRNGQLDGLQIDQIRNDISQVLGEQAELSFEFPDHIPPLPSGKMRFTVSNVTSQVGG